MSTACTTGWATLKLGTVEGLDHLGTALFSSNRAAIEHVQIHPSEAGWSLKNQLFLLRTALKDHPSVPRLVLGLGLGRGLTLIKTESTLNIGTELVEERISATGLKTALETLPCSLCALEQNAPQHSSFTPPLSPPPPSAFPLDRPFLHDQSQNCPF